MCAWKNYPNPEVPSPVLALTCAPKQIWAGGAGGVSHYFDGEWRLSLGLPLVSCSALVFAGGRLLAGGPDGLALSPDGGGNWARATIEGETQPVMAIEVSPRFSEDQIALAGTLGGGILRSEDGGKSWKSSNFGLQNNVVLALTWKEGDTVLAGTEAGIFRSTNGGAAWRYALGGEDQPVAGFVPLPGGAMLAASDGGRLLRSTDGGEHWTRVASSGLPETCEVQALALAPWGALLLSTTEQGVFQSADGGETWQPFLEENVMNLMTADGKLYGGLETGVAEIEAGGELKLLPPPLLSDLRSLLLHRQAPVVYGTHSGVWMYTRKDGWQPLIEPGESVTAVTEAPDGALLLSCSSGLLRSKDAGKTWETLLEGEAGAFGLFTFRQSGFGWAASVDGMHVYCTKDFGKHWDALETPFGDAPVVTLQISPRLLMAATYDLKTTTVEIWFSANDGLAWKRGPKVQTSWPVVGALSSPTLLTIGNVVVVLQPSGNWKMYQISGSSGIRRIVGGAKLLMALTNDGIFESTDRGFSWTPVNDCPPGFQIADLALTDDGLYLLMNGGQLMMRPRDK